MQPRRLSRPILSAHTTQWLRWRVVTKRSADTRHEGDELTIEICQFGTKDFLKKR